MLAAVLAVSTALTSSTAYAEAPEIAADEPIVEETLTMTGESRVFLRNGMRAITLTPGKDFCTSGDTSDAALAEEMAALTSEVTGYGMNTVFLDTDYEGTAFYDCELNSGTTVLGTAIENFRNAGMSVFTVLDVNKLRERLSEQGIGIKSGFSAAVHRFVMKYYCDGIILTNYYTADSTAMYAEYMRQGSGIGYENWLYETNEYIIRSISEITRLTNNTVAVGLMINDMWANSSSHADGSVTSDTVQAYFDGFSDTKKYVEEGYCDFVVVKAFGGTSSETLNFDTVVKWWYDLSEKSGSKTYIMHLNEKIGEYTGWYEDQLLRQLAVLEDYENIGGSAFSSYSALKANPLGTTDTLAKYFAEQINTDTIFEDLEMISPTSHSFVTYDSTVKFMGTFDENFDVYFDGKRIELNEVGNFYFQKTLNVGWNSYVIEHKGKQQKYSIERRVDVMTEVESGDVVVEGGTKITLSAVAYAGAKVSASIAGQIVNLTENENSGEELDANSSYAKYVGYYTAPDGMIGQQQALGEVSYYANYLGYEEYMTGGTVTIEAKPEPPKVDIITDIIADQSAVGTGEVVGTMSPYRSEADYVTYVRVTNNYTNVYDSKTTGAIPSPLFFQLPAGTLDYYKSESGGYITTSSGKRFREEDVTTFNDTGLGENALLVKAVGNTGGKSFIKIHLDYKSSFNITTPVEMFNDTYGEFGVKNYNTNKVHITFDNVTSVTKLPDFSACTLFSGGEWETVEVDGVPKFRLVLTLTQAGIYGGCGAYYDENGDLMLTFNVPTNSMKGKVIVIDPGHGYGKTPDKLDPGAIGNVTEQSVNLAVAKKLTEKLTALGATVYRLPTETDFILTITRPTVAREWYGADMYISLHCNSVENNPNAHGTETYYFTPYSQPLASEINAKLSAYFDNTAYGDGTVSSRGAKYSYYQVTLQQDFPSVLVEMGFISNERECFIMASSEHQDGIAAAIANGVYSYFARSNIAYAGNGSTDVPDIGGETSEPSGPETPAEPENGDNSEPSEDTSEPSESGDESSDESSAHGESEDISEAESSDDVSSDNGSQGGVPVE